MSGSVTAADRGKGIASVQARGRLQKKRWRAGIEVMRKFRRTASSYQSTGALFNLSA
jgi:hypothetical protein